MRRSALAPRWPDAGPTLARHSFFLARHWPDTGPTLILHWPATFVSWFQFWIFIINIGRRTRPNMFFFKKWISNTMFWENDKILIQKHVSRCVLNSFCHVFMISNDSYSFSQNLNNFEWFLCFSRFLMISNDLSRIRTDSERFWANEAFERLGGLTLRPDTNGPILMARHCGPTLRPDTVARHGGPTLWPDTLARHCGSSTVGPALWPDIVALAFGH